MNHPHQQKFRKLFEMNRPFLYLFENQLEIHITLANSTIILGLICLLGCTLYKLDFIIPSLR